jgi:hypothetical protein
MRAPVQGPARGRARLAMAAVAALVVSISTAPAESQAALRFTATIDGRDVGSIDANRPLELSADQLLDVTIAITNDGEREARVRSVRLESRVVGLTFFAYETRLDLTVARGTTEQRRFPIETLDLADQATGLLPARMTLLDPDRDVIASRRFAAEVDGSLWSVYGVFALLVLAITGVLLAAIIVRLAAHLLPANRWRRGVRFGTAGVGIGLTLTFSLSGLRLLLPEASRWLPLVLISAGVMFAIGYLTPGGHLDEDDLDDDALQRAESRRDRDR